MQLLEPLKIPLEGRLLIEAGAGTGKTYTIAQLYLRLLLERKLDVSAILVVTFTIAATEELRTRIRGRIREALDVLQGNISGDDGLEALLQQAGDSEAAAYQLNNALVRMDEAAIYTIHGFCQRMLQDHAFESGAPFEVDFLTSEQPLRLAIIEDFWRQRFYASSQAKAAWIASLWPQPSALLNSISELVRHREAKVIPEVDSACLSGLEKRCEDQFSEICRCWKADREEVREILLGDTCLRRSATTYRQDRVEEMMKSMDGLAACEEMRWKLDSCLSLFSWREMNSSKSHKKNCLPPRHRFFDCFDAFYTAHYEFLRLSRIHILCEAAAFLATELVGRKRELAALYFDDLLIDCAAALAGKRGKEFAETIRSLFPAALVDEFQDTDPLQYQIFSTIYKKGKGSLFMIGDPKQAIYSFRGADIFTYIHARRATETSSLFTMGTNYRSTASMVAAVNTLFGVADAFIFSRDICYTPVASSGKLDSTPFCIDGVVPSPLQALLLDEENSAAQPGKALNKEDARKAASAACAAQISELLSLGESGRATLGKKAVVSKDIAVLVRTHSEAEQVQQALAAHDIAAVLYSQLSVFATDAAWQFHRGLTAIAHCEDVSLIHNGLVTDLFGLTGADIDHLYRNEKAWQERLGLLEEYHRTWRELGFMAMFQNLLHREKLVGRISSRKNGERILTDFLHLAELLQEASVEHRCMYGLLRWLEQQVGQPDAQEEEHQLRLESDEGLIQIVTVHKAKGLEYPIVFLPFIWSGREKDSAPPFIFHNPEDLRLMVDLGGEDQEEHHRLVKQEQLAEELRLLYVAVTRARYCCYFCWGRISKVELSAMAYLLHQGKADSAAVEDDERMVEPLKSLNRSQELIAITSCINAPSLLQKQRKQEEPLTVKEFQGIIDTSWRITSYSQLAAGHEQRTTLWESQSASALSDSVVRDRFSFPRGAAAGTFLHTIFERIDFRDAAADALHGIIGELLPRFGFAPVWEDVVCQWLQSVIGTEIAPGLRLDMLGNEHRVNEMPFFFPLESFNLNHLNRILIDSGFSPLAGGTGVLHGLMKGYIDLVFSHHGQYYIADYKSNYLGCETEAYNQEQLAEAMDSHRYDLQALIYTLAVHRYLGNRLPGYSYEKHMGGTLYLFLRGMDRANTAGAGVYCMRPEQALIEQLDACCRGMERDA